MKVDVRRAAPLPMVFDMPTSIAFFYDALGVRIGQNLKNSRSAFETAC